MDYEHELIILILFDRIFNTHTHTHTHTHIHIHTYTHTYTHTHIYIYLLEKEVILERLKLVQHLKQHFHFQLLLPGRKNFMNKIIML